MNIYGKYADTLPLILNDVLNQIKKMNDVHVQNGNPKLYEHLSGRVKTNNSMVEKCQRKELPITTESALRKNRDAIGIRIVSNFIDDVYQNVALLKKADWCEVVKEKDYISSAKPNGYRSYHLILMVTTPYEDFDGNNPGKYYVEIQLRTIAMDTWASLEHEMKYKHNVKNAKIISRELKHCADDLASCDVTMQTIRQLINRED